MLQEENLPIKLKLVSPLLLNWIDSVLCLFLAVIDFLYQSAMFGYLLIQGIFNCRSVE